MSSRQLTKNLRDSRADRAHVRILMEQGYSDSRIAKETGISYAHVRQLTQQIRADSHPPHGAQVMAMTIEQERKAFEDWLTDCDTNPQAPPRDSRGNYLESDVRDMWRVWQVRAHLTQPAQAVDVEPLRKGFMTAESCGPDGHYLLKVKFQTLDDLQAAHNALTRALAGEKAGWRVPDGWREAFEVCYMRANEVGILHRDDDGEYTSVLTKVAWALWNERACLSPIDWWHASHDSEARAWTIHSPSGDSCEVHERASGPHAEILRQLAQSLPASPTDGEE